MLEVDTELHHRHRVGGEPCPLGCVKPPSEQSPRKYPSSSSPGAVCAQLGPCRAVGCVWGQQQMQRGSCAGLGLQGCTCSSFIYTHNQFTTSGKSFFPWMGRFGLQRDISTGASGECERALCVCVCVRESSSAGVHTALGFPSLGLRGVSVPPPALP